MASRPMNDEEVISEMNKMVCLARWLARFTNLTPPFPLINQVAFIKQEALEKAREIRVKADEEFAIEKVVVVVKLSTGLTDCSFRCAGEAR